MAPVPPDSGKFHDPLSSPNFALVDDPDIKAMLKGEIHGNCATFRSVFRRGLDVHERVDWASAVLADHLSANNTVVVTWDDKGKPVVRGSKTEGTLCGLSL